MRVRPTLLPALALSAVLAACGTPTTPTTQPDAARVTATEAAQTHNDADSDFTQMMIVHHQGALEMADVVVEKAATEPVRALGERIAAAQQPEIDLMMSWLAAWGEDFAHGTGMGHMDHTGMLMDGMDHDAAMAELAGLSGPDLDARFLELMIDHHRGAVLMAETEIAEGADPDVIELARAVVADQTAEIAEMEQMLTDLR